jgi:uncharacterized protein (TIGR03083 family)
MSERDAFRSAAAWFVDLVRLIPGDGWSRPGLGEWNVRELVGHATRAFGTVETYLMDPAESEDVTDPVDYYVLAGQADPEAIAQRGREAGIALGDDPSAVVAAAAERTLALVDVSPDDALVTSRGGGMRLDRYLATRTFELVIHGLDIVLATGVDSPPPEACLLPTAALATALAVRKGDGPAVCLALTGRRPLPPAYSAL